MDKFLQIFGILKNLLFHKWIEISEESLWGIYRLTIHNFLISSYFLTLLIDSFLVESPGKRTPSII